MQSKITRINMLHFCTANYTHSLLNFNTLVSCPTTNDNQSLLSCLTPGVLGNILLSRDANPRPPWRQAYSHVKPRYLKDEKLIFTYVYLSWSFFIKPATKSTLLKLNLQNCALLTKQTNRQNKLVHLHSMQWQIKI